MVRWECFLYGLLTKYIPDDKLNLINYRRNFLLQRDSSIVSLSPIRGRRNEMKQKLLLLLSALLVTLGFFMNCFQYEYFGIVGKVATVIMGIGAITIWACCILQWRK